MDLGEKQQGLQLLLCLDYLLGVEMEKVEQILPHAPSFDPSGAPATDTHLDQERSGGGGSSF